MKSFGWFPFLFVLLGTISFLVSAHDDNIGILHHRSDTGQPQQPQGGIMSNDDLDVNLDDDASNNKDQDKNTFVMPSSAHGMNHTCTLNCANDAIQKVKCTSGISDPHCFCQKQSFVDFGLQCIQQYCPEMVFAAQGLVKTLCVSNGGKDLKFPNITSPGSQNNNTTTITPANSTSTILTNSTSTSTPFSSGSLNNSSSNDNSKSSSASILTYSFPLFGSLLFPLSYILLV